jgi:hypothetical protein
MDVDYNELLLALIGSSTLLGTLALVYDGELGYAIGTGVLVMMSSIVSYIYGRSRDEVQEVRL